MLLMNLQAHKLVNESARREGKYILALLPPAFLVLKEAAQALRKTQWYFILTRIALLQSY